MTTTAELRADFIVAACAPRDAWHSSGTLERAEAILAAHPDIAGADIHNAAILGDDAAVRRFLAQDAANATAKGGPHGWDALTHLCFSRFLKLDRARSDGFVRAATALLDAGASANTGWFENDHQPAPEWESALYGAAGIAHHPQLTRLLLARGADPNDGEVVYHTPETWGNNDALKILVGGGKLTPANLALMLVRKLDWTDFEAVAWLLERGADANYLSHWGRRPLDHALGRDNAIEAFEILLDHGADPGLENERGPSTFVHAARMGRADVLDLFARRGFQAALEADDAFCEACARGDAARAQAIAAGDPTLVARLETGDAALLVRFAGAGNAGGVRILLDLGFDAGARAAERGTGGATPLHLAVWRGRTETVKLLIERRAPLEALAGPGETPLSLAVRAMVEMSEWTPHESTEIIAVLLDAGASVESVTRFPSGSAAADELLRQHGKGA